MLGRAASNAYSWWWASHIRTKQSKWLEHNLQDMEDKVSNMLKIIDEDGDSFAKRAEQYYRKRPELINFVEESFRAYRALAERYDHISKDMQNANRTIATVFPEQVQYAMDDEEDEENVPEKRKLPVTRNTPKSNVPMIPKIPKKEFKAHPTFISRKRQIKRSNSARATPMSSGLSKADALVEIDKLQKGILGMQTEKEFLKSSYENGLSKYWEIETQITEMQGRVCNLQDEFKIGSVIDDDEARKIMAETALKSCQRALIDLHEKQKKSAQDANIEYERIREAHKKFDVVRNNLPEKQTENKIGKDELDMESIEYERSREAHEKLDFHEKQTDSNLEKENHDMGSTAEKIGETREVNSSVCLTSTELAEKIDELADKVINLENEVSSQTALVTRLRSETDDLHAHIRSLEEDNETLIEGSDSMSTKLRQMEEELLRAKNLTKNVEEQNNHLQTHITEATGNLDHLSEKLQTVKPNAEDQNGHELKYVPDAVTVEKIDGHGDLDVFKTLEAKIKGDGDELAEGIDNLVNVEGEVDVDHIVKANLSNKFGIFPEQDKDAEQKSIHKKQESWEGHLEFAPTSSNASQNLEMENKQGEIRENFSNPFETEGEEYNLIYNIVGVVCEEDKEETQQNKYKMRKFSGGLLKFDPLNFLPLGSFSSVSKNIDTKIEKSDDDVPGEDIVQSILSNNTVGVQTEQKREHMQQIIDETQQLTEGHPKFDQSNFLPLGSFSGVSEDRQTEIRKIVVLEQDNKPGLQIHGFSQGQPKFEQAVFLHLGSFSSTSKKAEVEIEKKDISHNLVKAGAENKGLPDILSSEDLDSGPHESLTEEEDEPNWKKLYLNGLDTRGMTLLEEYTLNLRNFKNVKKKLSEAEKKSKIQIKELKNANITKDEEIQSLRKQLNCEKYTGVDQERVNEGEMKEDSPKFSNASSQNSNQQPLYVFLDDKYYEPPETTKELKAQENGDPTMEEKFRADIDDLLEENLEFWLRFSTSFHQIKKFQTSIQDLQSELLKLHEKQEGSSKNQSIKSDVRPIYKHLRELQTEVKLWFEHNGLLKDELQSRLSSLSNIEVELAIISSAGSEPELSDYQAAKFQGEVQNMKQENNKVAHELQTGLSRVNGLQVEIEQTLSKMDEDFGFSESRNHAKPSSTRSSRIPLRSFLFGAKLKKQKPSLFNCMNPALQKQYSDLTSALPP